MSQLNSSLHSIENMSSAHSFPSHLWNYLAPLDTSALTHFPIINSVKAPVPIRVPYAVSFPSLHRAIERQPGRPFLQNPEVDVAGNVKALFFSIGLSFVNWLLFIYPGHQRPMLRFFPSFVVF